MEEPQNPYADFIPAISDLIKICQSILDARATKGPAVELSFIEEDDRVEKIIRKRLDRFTTLYKKKTSDPGYHRHAVADFIERYDVETICSGLEDDWLTVDVKFSNPLPDVDTKGKPSNVDIFIGQFYHWAKSLDREKSSKLVDKLLYYFYWTLSVSLVGHPREIIKKLADSHGRVVGLVGGGSGDLKNVVRRISGMVQGMGIEIPKEGLEEMEGMDFEKAFEGIAGWLDNSPMKGMISQAAKGLQEADDQEGYIRGKIGEFLPESEEGLNKVLDNMKEVGSNLTPPDLGLSKPEEE